MKKTIAYFFSLLILSVFILSAAAEGRVLNICMQKNVASPIREDDGRYEYALKALIEKYPGIRVELLTISSDDYREALLDTSRDIDIILLLNPDIQSYAASGAVIPLSDQYALESATASWPKAAISLSAEDGKLYAIPHWIKPVLCRISLPKVYTALQLGISKDWGWNDLFAIAPALEAYNEQHGTNHRLLAPEGAAPQFITQLSAAVQNGQGLPKRSVIESLLISRKALKDAGLAGNTAGDQSNALFEFRLGDVNMTSSYLPLPSYAQDAPASELFVNALMVSANSDIKEEALDFLAFYTQPQALEASDDFLALGLNPEGTDAQTPKQYIQALEKGFARKLGPVYQAMSEAYNAFENGTLSLAEAADAIMNAK